MNFKIILIVFLIIGAYVIVSAYNYDLKDNDDKVSFLKRFWEWLKHLGGNIKEITGLVIGQDWMPETNETEGG